MFKNSGKALKNALEKAFKRGSLRARRVPIVHVGGWGEARPHAPSPSDGASGATAGALGHGLLCWCAFVWLLCRYVLLLLVLCIFIYHISGERALTL